MTVPLDQLYNFIDNISGHNLVIYRFYPHGSKKLKHLLPLKDYLIINDIYMHTCPVMICYDQEPVELDYSPDEILNAWISIWKLSKGVTHEPPKVALDCFKNVFSIRAAVLPLSVYDCTLLLHSDWNNPTIEKYQDQYIFVYYWSHALIARDWFRYAKIDPKLIAPKKYTHDFLIYNRAWLGTREYRLKFAELIIESQLHNRCRMGFSSVDSQVNYRDHNFKNHNFCISNDQIADYFFNNTTASSASADYNTDDYQNCAIEVVLETLFDDPRVHLTEKTLRPIACGHPFILVSTAGAVKYLHNYGFKTFDGLIDESYDQILDPIERLEAIVKVMKDIAAMSPDNKSKLIQEMIKIAKYNRDRFFSDDFQNYVVQELKHNLDTGIKKMYQNCTGKYFKQRGKFRVSQGRRLWPHLLSRQQCAEIWKWIHKHN